MIDTIQLVHHCHTDIGYTHDQPALWDLQRRFIDTALELADRDRERETGSAFKWTIETTAPLLRWLESASPAQVDQLLELEAAGRIEVTGMLANITPLYGPAQTCESLRPVEYLRTEYDLDIAYAMNCDVNGQNWPLADALLDAGIRGFSMGINEHFGGAPLDRPEVFRWEAPSGRELLAFNGFHYSTGLRLGIGSDAELLDGTWWPRIEARLEEIEYPLPTLMVQSYDPFGDNGRAYDGFTEFIQTWNSRPAVVDGDRPRIEMATPAEWWAVVEEHREMLPVYRGDWTDFWNFGSISSAREQGINRESRRRLLATDALEAALGAIDDGPNDRTPTRRSAPGTRDRAWWGLQFFDEHTWGADTSVSVPDGEDARSQWYHKAGYAYDARSLSHLLQRDGLAELSRHVNGTDGDRTVDDGVLVFNPLPWDRSITGPVGQHVVEPRGVPDDETATRHFQDRDLIRRPTSGFADDDTVSTSPWDGVSFLPATDVPGYGYALVPRDELLTGVGESFDERATVETNRYQITFDRERGGIATWYDAKLDCDWVDEEVEYPLAGFVHERVADRDSDRPRRRLFSFPSDVEDPFAAVSGLLDVSRGFHADWHAIRTEPERVLQHRVYDVPGGYEIHQTLDVSQVSSDVSLRVFVPDDGDTVVVDASWEMGLETRPEATYLAFPFAMTDPTPHVDVGGQAMEPGADQLPGSVYDYYTAQHWVDLSVDDRGMTVGCPLNPMVQFGDFHFAENQDAFSLENGLLLGWVTNNYWDTNFRAHQPGRVSARYHLTPHGGSFDESFAHRRGLEAQHWHPLVQTLHEWPVESPALSSVGNLLDLPEPPVIVTHVRPAGWDVGVFHPGADSPSNDDGVLVALRNASDRRERVTIGSGGLSIRSAARTDVFGVDRGDVLDVDRGQVTVDLAPRETATIRLDCRPESP